MRVLLTGGGTAGHITPALAIAETIRRNDPDAEIAFVGIHGGKEDTLIPREGYPLYYVRSQGIRRSLSLSNIKALWLAVTSPYSKQTRKVLEDFKPDIVIGTGGYACWPLMVAAAKQNIPTAVHESNALAGLTIRMLQRHVDRVWVNFEGTADQLKCRDKVLRVGNPLRGEFGAISKEEARRRLGISPDRFFVLSYGGSLGAEAINRAAVDLMKEYASTDPSILFYHATGTRDYRASLQRFREEGLDRVSNCILIDYIYDMPLRMAAADLIISRAGAMTLSELALMKKAAILIPSPYVAENHQYRNAKELADANAALLIEEKELGSGALTRAVRELRRSASDLREMERSIPDFADPDANKRIWNEIRSMTKQRK